VVAAVVGAAALLGGCSWLHFGSQDEAYDYRKAKPRQEPLEVPPDLSQLPKDDRFNFPAKPANADAAKVGDQTVAAVSPGATAAASSAAVAPAGEVVAGAGVAPQVVTPGMVAPAGVLVAPVVVGAQIMRDGDQRWLVVEASPELVYTTIKDLWTSLGYKITTDDPRFGVLETDWSETHPEINEDAIRNALHRAFGAFDANGNRHKYRALIERTARTHRK